MTSLRELIEGKARRTAQLPILVGDASAAAAAVAKTVASLQEHQRNVPADGPTEEDEATEKRLRDEVTAAVAAQQQTVVFVELQALPADEWDAVFGPLEPDENGEISLDSVRAVLLAASCVDPELQDVDWWEQQIGRPEWSKGDKLNANNVLLDLNHSTPQGPPGKG